MTKQQSEFRLRQALKELQKSHNIFFLKIFNHPSFFTKTPFDFLVLSKDRGLAIESKQLDTSKNKRFSFDRVPPHQLIGLKEFEKTGDRYYSYLLISLLFKEEGKRNRYDGYLIPIPIFENYIIEQQYYGMKSAHIDDIQTRFSYYKLPVLPNKQWDLTSCI